MKLTLADAKIYLRVDSADEDDAVIVPIIATAKQLVKDVARSESDFSTPTMHRKRPIPTSLS